MADLNPAPVVSIRHPRGAVKLNGAIVTGWTSWEVDSNNHSSADTFRVTFAASDLPAEYGPGWFASQTSITVEVFSSANPADPARYAPVATDRRIYGKVDSIAFSPVEREIEISGRDLTAELIDTKTAENHQNSTASQVATLLAQRHGLTPVVTATTTRIGQFYQLDHTDINAQQSEWDLLHRLAEFEGFDVFVTGTELHFQPKAAEGGDSYAIVWTPASADTAYDSATATELHFSRDLTIAKGVTVEVRSWNAKQKKGFTAAWPKAVKSAKPGAATNSNQTYHRTIPGLNQDQAVARAKALYDLIVAHLVKMDADLPGDDLLDCTKTITVRGTGTAFDQVYYPDSVKRSMSVTEGYRMSVTAKNLSQEVEADA